MAGATSDWPQTVRRAFAWSAASLAVLALIFDARGAGTSVAVLASLSLIGSLVQLLMYDGDLALLPLLVAVWVALQVAVTGHGRHLLAVASFAFQARIWLVALAATRKRERLDFADTIEARRPETAIVFVDNDIESEVPLGTLREGHIYRVAPGQILPADGFVTFGSGFVDESMAGDTEDLRMKGMGSAVFAGTRNKNATLLVRATAVGERTFAYRLTAALRRQSRARRELLPDAAGLATALLLWLISGPAAAFAVLLVSSGAGVYAALAASDFSLARAGAAHRWLWDRAGLTRLSGAGMLVTTAPLVLTEGRPKLAAVETTGTLSEDAVLGLLGPVARKLETPAAFAVLLELRARNIPLQMADFFELREGGGLAFVGGEEIRWVALEQLRDQPPLGALEGFVHEHQNAGEEICLLEREGTIQAALAFRDATVKGAHEAAEALRDCGYPVLLVSPLPKRCTARLQTELGVEHAQGESGERETEALVSRLAGERLSPAWVQTGPFRPSRAAAVVARAGAADEADLLVPDPALPDVAAALGFATRARARLRLSLGFLYGVQAGLVLALVAGNPVVAGALHAGAGWVANPLAVAIVGVLPGFFAFFLAHVRAAVAPPANIP